MFSRIDNEPDLWCVLARSCDENDIHVDVCEELLVNGDLNDDLIRVIKVDRYYGNCKLKETPKSVDCLIVIKCADGGYGVYLVELRNAGSSKGVRPTDILSKFRNTFEDFLIRRFPEIFGSEDFNVNFVLAWLVTDPFRGRGLPAAVYDRKIKGTVLDVYQTQKPFRWRTFSILIKPELPNPEICVC